MTRNSIGPKRSRLIEDAKVRDGDGDNVGLRRHDVLRMDRPYAGIREVECALGLALIDPLEAADDVRVTGTRRSHGEHSNQTGGRIRQYVDDDVEGAHGRRRRRAVVAVVKRERTLPFPLSAAAGITMIPMLDATNKAAQSSRRILDQYNSEFSL